MSVKPIVAVVLALAVGACSGPRQGAPDRRISVVTSISTFTSIVEAVGGSRVRVQSLVPVGASPETYQPKPQDVATLAHAALLVENGAGLESWLARTVANAGSASLRVLVCSDGLTIKNNNPHLWMDPQNAKAYTYEIRDALITIDPQHSDEYRDNARHYAEALDRLTRSIARQINSIPREQRVMIVFHNAWQYYNDRFGIATLGFIEANPGQDPNPQQIAHLIDLARAHHVRAIFSEPEYSPKLAHQIAGNANISIVDDLYDDSVGTDPRVGDYIAMLTYDTDVIVRALR